MCECIGSKDKYQFVQHNVFFLSWLLVTKKDVKICKTKDKEVYIISGIDSDTYKEYKKEYKKHRTLLRDIKIKLKIINNL